ncbi:HNH endonuclease signature motif containing protein [Flavobacterium sp. NRK1]|uniref:HNH endonuclease signature motif containing protein n=1 Tax=Flavobacterium sp. NRK1 TaxID=2954929 RepID=UPI00209224A2|nr:HNH endonuclease signature motif containing protein [Flavobacterium sp. NRK1]MCO6149080.1 HNH endonuclease [Flavobacterium sp. NRK1]
MKPKKIVRPWVKEHKPFERERHSTDFDYNGRKWRKLRLQVLEEKPLCNDCKAEGVVTRATVVDHEPTAKVLISKGLDPYDKQYLFPLCKKHHNAKSGREAHAGGMG